MLRDKDFYNVSAADITELSSEIIFYSMIAQMISVLLMGYIYDIFGRRYTLAGFCIGSGATIMISPLGAPNPNPYIYLMRCLFVLFGVSYMTHPFINDYVLKESRGKASAL